tara:strand:- start:311 stop:538 length:228 start_codon:yes stop_codon:yes gene_type:complete
VSQARRRFPHADSREIQDGLLGHPRTLELNAVLFLGLSYAPILEDRKKFLAVLQGGALKAGRLAPKMETTVNIEG